MQLQVPATDIMHLTQAQAHIHSHTHETVSIKTRRVWEAFVAQLNSIELSWTQEAHWHLTAGSQWLAAAMQLVNSEALRG